MGLARVDVLERPAAVGIPIALDDADRLGDALVGLDHLRAAGVTADERITEAIGIVEGNRDADRRWPLQNVHPGEAHFEMDDGEGLPSRWNTLRALRVLAWSGRGA